MKKRARIGKNMLHLVMWLLASTCLGSHVHREYHLVTSSKSWDDAQSYCRETHTDLATVGSRHDMETLAAMTAPSHVKTEIWIGLRETGVATWLWSVGETLTSQGLAEYTNWASLPVSSHLCGGMRSDGKWLSAHCGTKLPYACQEDKGSGGVYVVMEEKTWRNAQNHCRQNAGDLASVMNRDENLALQREIRENMSSPSLVWIGLFKDGWRWSDQSGSSLRAWYSSQPNDDGACVLYNTKYKRCFDRNCANLYPFYCHGMRKETFMRRLVRVEVQSSSVINLNDIVPLNQTLNDKYGIKLSWRVQRGGKVFHKEKKKTQEACENGT